MARVHWIALAGVASVLASPLAAALPTPSLDPVSLFTQTCTKGGAHLPSNVVTAVDYDRMAPQAKVVLSMGAPDAAGRAGSLFTPLSKRDVPNNIYRIGDWNTPEGKASNIYLILADPGAKGALASSCAVVWKANAFDDARHAVSTIVGQPLNASDPYVTGASDIQAYAAIGNGFSIKAAQVEGWTMLRATPEPRTAAK